MFAVGNIYANKHSKDVVAFILASQKTHSGYVLSIQWVNVGPHPAFLMSVVQEITIPAEKVSDWYELGRPGSVIGKKIILERTDHGYN